MKLFFSYIYLFLAAICASYCQEVRFTNISIENGLSQSSVLSIAQDKRGFLWFGTRAGLNRYDAHRFTIYKNELGEEHSLSDNYITALLCDGKGRLWIGTSNGLNLYDEATDRFLRIPLVAPIASAHVTRNITCLYEDAQGRLWIGTKDALYLHTMIKGHSSFRRIQLPIEKNYIRTVFVDHKGIVWVALVNGIIRLQETTKGSFRLLPRNSLSGEAQIAVYQISSLVEDNAQNIWLGTLAGGLFRYSETSGILKKFDPFREAGTDLPSSNIRKLLLDDKDQLWIATQDGLSLLTKPRTHLANFANNPWNSGSLSQNSVHSLLQDKAGTIWAGTFFGGVNAYHAYHMPFFVYNNRTFRKGLNNNVVSSIVEDEQQNLWIGTEGGGLNYWQRSNNQFTHYTHHNEDPQSLGSNLVKVVYKDKENHIWVGTHGGGLNRFNASERNFSRFMWKDHATIGSEITSLLHDHHGQLWVGTETGGIQLFKLNDTLLIPINSHPILQATQRRAILTMLETSDRHIWIGGPNLFKIVSDHTIQDPVLWGNTPFCINSFFQDSAGNVWLATAGQGLIQCDMRGQVKATYTERDGLSNNNVLGILSERGDLLWISTANGLSRFDLRKKAFNTYNEADGLAGNVFNNNAFFKAASGELFFGGYKGLTAFDPRNISINRNTPPVFITSFHILGNEASTRKKNRLVSNELLKKEVTLTHEQNTFTVQVAALNYIKPEKNQYRYQLAGYDKAWRYTDMPSLTYSNLTPGDYTLYVKAANNDNIWSAATHLQIHVLPPIWKTPYAYCLYLLGIFGILFLILRHFFLRALLKKNEEITQFKLNFFTHISHEIRTHLTLITGPTEDLINEAYEHPTELAKLTVIKNNSDSLLKLVNELLDFRKIEAGMQSLKVSNYNLIAFIKLVISAFDSHTTRNPLHLISPTEILFLYFDKEQLEKVLVNLIANAFKFSEQGETIEICIEHDSKEVFISITNIGIGISTPNLDKIFAPYFQENTDRSVHIGNGIGLALSKSIIDLHHGSISVKSTSLTDRAASKITFTISLMRGTAHFSGLDYSEDNALHSAVAKKTVGTLADTIEIGKLHDASKQVLLLVEDNASMRNYLRSILEQHYNIIACQNGLEGLEQAFEHIPDVIVSDVMMPEMDGFTFCERIKTDQRTSHIPLVLLTAKSAMVHQITGLQNGADAYISKPFSPQVLRLQLNNLLKARQVLWERYQRLLKIAPETDGSTSGSNPALENRLHPLDEAFLKKLTSLTVGHLDNPAFGVAWLAEKIGMSQPVLFKKIKAITGLSANDFVKSQRMLKATELLKENRYTVYEIAFMIGYDNSKYFSREFKKWFGETPSEYGRAQAQEN